MNKIIKLGNKPHNRAEVRHKYKNAHDTYPVSSVTLTLHYMDKHGQKQKTISADSRNIKKFSIRPSLL